MVKYAIFSKDVKAKDKYVLTTPPKKFFNTRKAAHNYAKQMKYEDYKVMIW